MPRKRGDSGRLLVTAGAVIAGCVVTAVVAALVFAPGRDQSPGSATAEAGQAVPVARAMTSSPPSGLRIPAIDLVTEDLVELGRTPRGVMEVPADARHAGWYATGPAPGEAGTAVIAGYVVHGYAKGVFARLHELRPGAEVVVHRQDGKQARFAVDRVETYPRDAVPEGELTGSTTGGPELRLVTCNGDYDPSSATQQYAVVVSAHLLP
ncbi:class F sortase [Amycolatopsis suaedae]|nr:class F sortase [Amycolatopsis suaedae]